MPSESCVGKDFRIYEEKGPRFGVRYQQCFLLFCGMLVMLALQTNLSFAIVAMTDKNTANPDFEEFKWNEETKSTILGSFFWGYVVTQIPAGPLAARYGGKLLLLIAAAVSSTLNIITPVCASKGGWELLLVLRFTHGLFYGFLFPSTQTLLAKWSPIDERARLGFLTYSGTQVGSVAVLAVGGVIASSSLGWPGLFYIWGMIGLIWCTFWYILGYNSPAEHRSITIAEKRLICSAATNSEKKLSIPWGKIFTSLPFYALCIAQTAQGWGFWIMLIITPTYMKSVLGMQIKENALLSSLPACAMFIMGFVFWILADIFKKKFNMSLKCSRKLFNSIGFLIPALTLIGLGFVSKENSNLAVILLIIAVGTNSGAYFGYSPNHIDLSPNFAGILMGVANCIATIASVGSFIMVGLVVKDESDPAQWRIIFLSATVAYVIGNSVFVLFGKVETQSWDSQDTLDKRYHVKQDEEDKEATNFTKPA